MTRALTPVYEVTCIEGIKGRFKPAKALSRGKTTFNLHALESEGSWLTVYQQLTEFFSPIFKVV
jgi:hypothetical protein